MGELTGKNVFITGGSRGIGRAIALKLAAEGANIVIAAKTTEPHPKLPGTIYSVAEEVEVHGVKAVPLKVDIRYEEEVEKAVAEAANRLGGIDILVNNASAINLTPSLQTDMKRFDLMFDINVRGTFLCSKVCAPYLKDAENPHILVMSPPINLDKKWFGNHVAYTISKYGMSMCVMGMAEEYKTHGVAVNALWPKTTIKTAAVQNLLGGDKMVAVSRTPEIVADAAFEIFKKDSRTTTGNFFIDEEVMKNAGITDLKPYQVHPELPEDKLFTDLFM